MASTSWGGYGPAVPSAQSTSTDSTQQTGTGDRPRNSRQLLSCTKCRERKVKCDRTKPCSACCARGHPKDCVFIVGEGDDYTPIPQSYEIRKLRIENQRLREKLQAQRHSHSADDDDDDDDEREQSASRGTGKVAAARQRRFKSITNERAENVYFGSPGLASIVSDFANLQVGGHSLTHTLPQLAQQIYSVDSSTAYPFPLVDGHNSLTKLSQLLPPREETFALLDSFQRRAQSCSFPHVPDEVTKKEVDRFLSDAANNAEKFPDMLGLIFVTLATGMQMGLHDRCGGQWDADGIEQAKGQGDVFIACSMQALRLGSFMNQPTLLGVQVLVMLGPYLTNNGRFLDAWTLFGTTIRVAHGIGLHRNPKILNPAPPLRECILRQNLWWWMLHMDQQYSVTLGRPLGISGIGDCPSPKALTTNPTTLRLDEFVIHFTILARQILSSDALMSVAKIDDLTDQLVKTWDTMPEAVKFNETWLSGETVLPDWPLEVMSATLFAKVQCFLLLLNRQRVERTQATAGGASPATSSQTESDAHHRNQTNTLRGRPLVISSSIHIVKVLLFFHYRNPAVLISWTICQQAFNACMILILDAWETENEQNEWLVSQAYAVFTELESNNVHSLAEHAVRRISDGLAQLGNRKAERDHQAAIVSKRQNPTTMMPPNDQQQMQYDAPMLTLDTSSLSNLSDDTVMGNTGMFLLEDAGFQSYRTHSFSPLTWNMAESSSASPYPSDVSPQNTTPQIPASNLPAAGNVAAPFQMMSRPNFIHHAPPVPTPYTIGLQPRLSDIHRRTSSAHHEYPHQPPQPHAQHHHDHHQQQQPIYAQMHMHDNPAFTPINVTSSFDGVSPIDPEFLPDSPFRPHHPRRQSYPQSRKMRHPAHQRQSTTGGQTPREDHGSGDQRSPVRGTAARR